MKNNMQEVFEYIKDDIRSYLKDGYNFDTCKNIKDKFLVYGVEVQVSPVYSTATSSIEGIQCLYKHENKKFALDLSNERQSFSEIKWF
jgi:hypothetical protein